jgi:hypothetical protein
MRRTLLPVLLLLSACITWAPVPAPTPDPGGVEPGPIRIVGSDSFVRVARAVTIDSQMVRFTRPDATLDSIPRSAVARFERKKFNATGTIALAGVILIVGYFVGAATENSLEGLGDIGY